MAPPRTTQPSSNNHSEAFDTSAYLQKSEFDAEIESIGKRLDAIELRTKDKAAIIAMLKEVFEDDRNIDPIMTEYFKNHIDLQPLIQTAVDAMDKRLVKAFMKKTGIWILGAMWSLLLIAATAYITVTITNANTPKTTVSSSGPANH